MKHVRLLSFVTALGLLGLTAGCTMVQRGSAAGGALGGVGGAILGHNVSAIGVTRGIVVGATGGAAVGGLAADAYEHITDSDRERELENLRAQLADRENEIAGLQPNNIAPEMLSDLENAKSELERRIAELEAQNSQMAMRQSELENQNNGLRSLNDDVDRLNNDLQRAREALERALLDAEDARRLREQLENEANRLRGEIEQKSTDLEAERNRARLLQTSLDSKAQDLANLKAQLDELNVQLEETSRGLTLTIAEQLLYRPGKAELSTEGKALIGKVAAIITGQFPGRELMIEGHTDNQPIQRSGWKSNWELGSARSLTVLHELVNNHGFDPTKISAVTYGEHRPNADNRSSDGRKENRRSVIVIMPEKLELEKTRLADTF